MEPNEVLNLFDSLWFYPGDSNTPAPDSDPNNLQEIYSRLRVDSTQLLLSPATNLGRSRSEELSCSAAESSAESPNSSHLMPHLETILSEKDLSRENTERTDDSIPQLTRTKRKTKKITRRWGGSKSLSELEFEELKGFIDLGFVFSVEDKNSSLAEIIPGLQRLGRKKEGDGAGEREGRMASTSKGVEEPSSGRRRPYLSEAWETAAAEKERKALAYWRVPAAAVIDEVVMKDSLRRWAHTVAFAAL